MQFRHRIVTSHFPNVQFNLRRTSTTLRAVVHSPGSSPNPLVITLGAFIRSLKSSGEREAESSHTPLLCSRGRKSTGFEVAITLKLSSVAARHGGKNALGGTLGEILPPGLSSTAAPSSALSGSKTEIVRSDERTKTVMYSVRSELLVMVINAGSPS